MKYYNPIIPGFNPDPSICRVGEDYYLVTSTFEFFPGVPIYHSKNLINWEHIGYCLTRDSQLPLQNCPTSAGIYAPTLRYHDGVFFMVTTNVSGGGNFIVHTTDIRGEWSEPAWVKQGGIDPSLFWDDDGTCYFVSNAKDRQHHGHYLCKVNPFTGEMLTESTLISPGCGGKASEAPHIYKINGWYYLMIAEGGTEYGHMEKMLRSKDIYGPYEACPHNPILTHRESGDVGSSRIQATGHADIVEDQNGNWWLVCLGLRPIKQFYHNLGRESFLTPMYWDENGWPVVGNNGRINLVMDGPLPGPEVTPVTPASYSFMDDFDGETFDLRWNYVRNPQRERYILKDSMVTLFGNDVTLSTPGGSPTMIAVRQQAFDNDVTAKMLGDIALGQKSGITVFYHQGAHYEILLTHESDGYYVCLRRRMFDLDIITERHKIDYQGSLLLKMETAQDYHSFYYENDGEWTFLGKGMTAPLCKEVIFPHSFTGCYLGMFSEHGTISFDYFKVDVKDEVPEK